MNRKGSMYIVMLCFFVLLLLIGAYIALVQFYGQYKNFEVTKDIGSKQSAIIVAVQEGERIQAYIREAVQLAAVEAGRMVRCGEPYLGRTLVRAGDSCVSATGSSENFRNAFNKQLLAYPGSAMQNAEWREVSENPDEIKIQGTVRIPLAVEASTAKEETESAPFSGSYTGWPTPEKRITSYFGNRLIPCSQNCPSKNHPGLDISTRNPLTGTRVGTPITAIGSGEAEYVPKEYDMHIRVYQDDGAIVEYVHIEALSEKTAENEVLVPRSPQRVRVEAGQVIGKSAAIEFAHLHLQVRFPEIQKNTVENLDAPTSDGKSWREHVGPSNMQVVADTSYAVTRVQDNAAFLNPICFFDRTMMEEIVRSSDTTDDEDLEERRREQAFNACNYYGALGLDGRLLTSGKPTEEAVPIPQPSESHPLIKETQENIQRLNLQPSVEEAAAQEDVDPRLMLAIITQESQGNEKAISPTGPAGIAQFSADTAKAYFPTAEAERINACCRAGETGAACQNPQRNLCDENTDPRFDPHKSVEAQAKLLKANTQRYNTYEQQIAFAIAAYNGGGCPVDYVLKELGSSSTITWQQVRDRMLVHEQAATRIACGSNDNYLPDWGQIADYGTAVLRWYEAWGGTTFSGTAFSSESIGYYDLAVRITTENPIRFEQVLRDAQRNMRACTDEACIERQLREAAERNQVQLRDVSLTADPPVCLQREEAALAYYANQVSWCLSSPDTNCNCEITTAVDAVLAVTGDQLQLQQLNGENVQTTPMLGFAYPAQGEVESDFTLRVHTGIETLQAVHVTWNTKADQVVVDGRHWPVLWLHKEEDGLSFTNVAHDVCVTPPQPQAYCMVSEHHEGIASAFYVDNIIPTEPEDTLENVAATQQGNNVRLNFTAAAYPYVHLTLHQEAGREELYLQVHDDRLESLGAGPSALGIEAEFVRSDAGEYIGVVPYAEQYTITLMDKYLHETPPARITPQAEAPRSPFELP